MPHTADFDGDTRPLIDNRLVRGVLFAEAFVSILLVGLMAGRSPIDAHPDEALHVRSAEYFRRYWLPPRVGAQEAAATYSNWGMSYVDEADVIYLAFGGAAALGEWVGLSPAGSMRLLQALLYIALVSWITARAKSFTPALGFIVLTPQVWYVFSYVNGDGFPFLLLTGLLLELSSSQSSLRTYLRQTQSRAPASVWAIGVAIGLLALSKRNYLVSIGFLCLALGWLGKEVTSWTRLAVPVAAAALIAVPWMAYHGWVNDFQTRSRILAHADQVALPELRPSFATQPGSSQYVDLRAKGVPLSTLLTEFAWAEISFRSFSGLYGWMDVIGPAWIYRAFALLDALLLALLMLPVAVHGSARARALLGGVLVFAGLVVAQTLYRSWTLHFQPQGRYLFPMLPMLLFYWRQCDDPRLRTPSLVVAACLGALSILSFTKLGLAALIPQGH